MKSFFKPGENWKCVCGDQHDNKVFCNSCTDYLKRFPSRKPFFRSANNIKKSLVAIQIDFPSIVLEQWCLAMDEISKAIVEEKFQMNEGSA